VYGEVNRSIIFLYNIFQILTEETDHAIAVATNVTTFFIQALLLLAIGFSHSVYAEEKIEIADINRFGKNLTNKNLYFEGIIKDAAECRLD
jgi:hypothetical protein